MFRSGNGGRVTGGGSGASFAAARSGESPGGSGVGSRSAVRGSRPCDGNGPGGCSRQAVTAGRGAGWGIRPAAMERAR